MHLSETLQNVGRKLVADVERTGDKIIIPSGVTIDQVIDLLNRRKKFEEEETVIRRTFPVFPLDGAVALDRALNSLYGWAPAIATPGFFTSNPPQLIQVNVGPNEVKSVPWGRFKLPNVEGHVDTSIDRGDSGCLVFQVVATVKRKNEPEINKLFEVIGQEIKAHSIYRGKAIKIRFRDDEGEPLPMPKPVFLDTSYIKEDQLVYSRHVMDAVNTNLFTPIRRAADCIRNKIQLKRGVILGGVYGTGKTLAAAVASKIAVETGITYVYAERADELKDALEFAKQYQSPASVVFVEDIDRDITGERTHEMDAVLNTIDGVDGKHHNIIVVLTTNALDKVHKAMLRPGRLDAVINITPPDAEAVARLIVNYGGGLIRKDANLAEVGKVLDGQIPAVIAEVVKRAKLSQLAIQPEGTELNEITPAALLEAARTMAMQIDLLRGEQPRKDHSSLEERIIKVIQDGLSETGTVTEETQGRLRKLDKDIRQRLEM
jgi:transitional endoplasmic reticulum ATPase